MNLQNHVRRGFVTFRFVFIIYTFNSCFIFRFFPQVFFYLIAYFPLFSIFLCSLRFCFLFLFFRFASVPISLRKKKTFLFLPLVLALDTGPFASVPYKRRRPSPLPSSFKLTLVLQCPSGVPKSSAAQHVPSAGDFPPGVELPRLAFPSLAIRHLHLLADPRGDKSQGYVLSQVSTG